MPAAPWCSHTVSGKGEIPLIPFLLTESIHLALLRGGAEERDVEPQGPGAPAVAAQNSGSLSSVQGLKE